MMKPLTDSEVSYSMHIAPEIAPLDGHFEDAESEAWIRRQLQAGNMAAWCSVRVTARWTFLSASAGVACCSFESVEDAQDDLYDGLKLEALAELNNRIQRLASLIRDRETERPEDTPKTTTTVTKV